MRNTIVTRRFGLGVYLLVYDLNITKALLLRLSVKKQKSGGRIWGNVGGKVNIGETSRDACAREAREEIGLSIEPLELTFLFVKEEPMFSPDVHGIQFFYGLAIDINCHIAINSEAVSHRWFPIGNIPSSALDSRHIYLLGARLLKERLETRMGGVADVKQF